MQVGNFYLVISPTFLIEEEKMDDAVILSIIMRAQAAGFNAYLMPQAQELPMSNRRDDILIVKP